MQKALNASHLSSIHLGLDCPPILSLMFADGLIVCGIADNADVKIIASIINQFCDVSSQTPNYNTSAILFSKYTGDNLSSQIKTISLSPNMEFNTTHLGHPLILNGKNRHAAYNFIY